MMTRRTHYDWEAELKEAFRIFDMDGNGYQLTSLSNRMNYSNSAAALSVRSAANVLLLAAIFLSRRVAAIVHESRLLPSG